VGDSGVVEKSVGGCVRSFQLLVKLCKRPAPLNALVKVSGVELMPFVKVSTRPARSYVYAGVYAQLDGVHCCSLWMRPS